MEPDPIDDWTQRALVQEIIDGGIGPCDAGSIDRVFFADQVVADQVVCARLALCRRIIVCPTGLWENFDVHWIWCVRSRQQ